MNFSVLHIWLILLTITTISGLTRLFPSIIYSVVLTIAYKLLARTIIFYITNKLPCKVIKGPDGLPFLERYYLFTINQNQDSAVVLHRFVRSDPDRGYHDHPWSWAFSIILAGGYSEYVIPRLDTKVSNRLTRSFSAGNVNWLNTSQYHRVLVDPTDDCWTLFVMGPRVKVWGFAANPDAHRYSSDGSTTKNHYNRKGIERKLASTQDNDVNFTSEILTYRPYTSSIESSDKGWWRTAEKGYKKRLDREAVPTIQPEDYSDEHQ
eukprot:TRINITY_DN10946_c0_g1_i1.p1 TRINITY_DN10946_c0_g1~~TRINITY_DN10946_c0_g1_i1.p1  ORF type:complete len:264 (-),score=15.19 TRINITY_DN10946_c0_g1_i1:108-899(-)